MGSVIYLVIPTASSTAANIACERGAAGLCCGGVGLCCGGVEWELCCSGVQWGFVVVEWSGTWGGVGALLWCSGV